MSMRLKLFVLLTVLVITMSLGIMAILLFTGTFTAGLKENEEFIKEKLSDLSDDILNSFDKLSAETVYLSKKISSHIENELNNRNFNITNLQKNPDLIEELMYDIYDQAFFALQKTKSSGVFIILNATINDRLPYSQNSKAGIYLKNMEPNIVNSSTPTINMFRGIPDIARNNSLNLHSQWEMEFNVSDASYYHLPMEKASEKLPLSRQYYWNPAIKMPNSNEEIMMCSAPLIDSNGNIFGVCGFDVSEMLFKLSFDPDNNNYNRLFCMISPASDNSLKMNNSLISGNYPGIHNIDNEEVYYYSNNNLYKYECSDEVFIGYHKNINLYPDDSVFSHDKWVVSLMIPAEDIKTSVIHLNMKLLILCLLLMVLGIVISFILSKYYLKPISKGIDLIKSNDLSLNEKTQIKEIDELIEFLSKKVNNINNTEKEQESIILDTFVNNVKSLSPAERSVFNLYAQQYQAKEIAEILFLSINTIKTHTKKIYNKMNVNSREELLLYIEMLKEAGKEIK